VSAAAALLDRLGRPGTVRLGSTTAGRVTRLATGLPALDAVLEGGLPRGCVTELAGTRSAGRTGLACRIAASATNAGETIAWVDPDDALDPEAATGVTLARTLWVRPRDVAGAFGAAEILLGAGGFGLVVLDLGSQPDGATRSTSWMRLARAAERTRSTLLVLTAASQTGTCAALRLELTGRRARWSSGPGRRVLLDGVTARLTVARSRGGGAGRSLVVRQACA
jgi:RecA/RadA recombinase